MFLMDDVNDADQEEGEAKDQGRNFFYIINIRNKKFF